MYFRSGSYKVGIMTNLNKDDALVALEVDRYISNAGELKRLLEALRNRIRETDQLG